MTLPSRIATASAVALAIALTLGGCTPETSVPESQGIAIEGTAPLTVQGHATWEAAILEGAPVQVTPLGVLTFSADKSVAGESYVPVLLSPENGAIRWSGTAIESATMPDLYWVETGVEKWAVAKTTSEHTVTLHSWNGLANRADATLLSSVPFTGTAAAPTVTVTGSGVLVTGADATAAEPLLYWPADGSLTRYQGGPQRNGQPGTPIGAYGDGFLVAFPEGGFSFVSVGGGWTSTDVAPDDVDDQKGTVLTQGRGYVIVEWPRPADQTDALPLLAVHSAADGRVLAQHELTDEEQAVALAQATDGAPVVTDASAWLAWGCFGVDLSAGTITRHNLEGGTPTAIIDGLLYVRGAYTLLPTPGASASATPEPTATADAIDADADQVPTVTSTIAPDAPEGFSGVVGVDLATGQPMAGLPSLYPVGRSSTGQVILRNDLKPSVYSVPLR